MFVVLLGPPDCGGQKSRPNRIRGLGGGLGPPCSKLRQRIARTGYERSFEEMEPLDRPGRKQTQPE